MRPQIELFDPCARARNSNATSAAQSPMPARAGERRLRALYPEPGHREWVAPPPAHLKCSVCEEPFGRAVQAQVSLRALPLRCELLSLVPSRSLSHAAIPSAGAVL